MKNIKIKEFDFDKGLTQLFINFKINHLSKYPYIIPPFKTEEEKWLDKSKNPFLERVRMKRFLAFRGETVEGRIAAMINPDILFEDGKLGLIGFFEVVECFDTAKSLFTSAISWLRKNNCTHVWGPMDISIYHSYRFAVDKFDSPAYIGEPKNPPYYPEYFLKYGFKTKEGWITTYLDRNATKKQINGCKEHYEMATKLKYNYQKVVENPPRKRLEITWNLMMKIYSNFTGFHEISKDEFIDLFSNTLKFIDYNSSIFIINPEGHHIGFFIVFKNLANAVRAMNGKEDLFAKLKFLLNKQYNESLQYHMGLNYDEFLKGLELGKNNFGKPLRLTYAFRYLVVKNLLKNNNYEIFNNTIVGERTTARRLATIEYLDIRNYSLFELII